MLANDVPLELHFRRELDRARAADLVQRIQAAVLTATSEVVVQHLRRLSELGRAQIVDRATEVRVVKKVEEIASELKVKFLSESELAAQGHIPLSGAERAQGIASQIALRSGRNRRRKSRRVNDLATCCAGRMQVERLIGNNARALRATCSGKNSSSQDLPSHHIDRRSGADVNDRIGECGVPTTEAWL